MTAWTEDKRLNEFSCTPLCLPQFGLHSIPCDVKNRRDPILKGRVIADND